MISDAIHAFTFDSARVRGRVVRLEETWRTIRDRGDYTGAAQHVLGEMLAIVAMLAHGIKLDGSVILQLRDDRRIGTAMVECTHRTTLRGIVREATLPVDARLSSPASLAITLKPQRGRMYQGVVPVDTASVARAVEHYFETSEQLPTRIWAAANDFAVGGLLLQRLPDAHIAGLEPAERTDEDWRRLQLLASTVTERELLRSDPEALLTRLFPGEAIRLRAADGLSFGCSCSRERTANVLKVLGRDEVDDILAQEGRIDVTCEFCGERYLYDPIDARLLFEPLARPPGAPQ